MTWREFRIDVTDELIDRFFANVDPTPQGEHGCLVWTGVSINAFGHGHFDLGRTQEGNRGAPAHRVAWVIEHRQVIPPKIVVRHKTCNNPPCVRHDHLALGTITQNMLDKRDAMTMPCGEGHYAHKLTESDVREIRDRYLAGDGTAEMLAEDYGVTESNVVQILSGKTWKHVTGGVSITQPAWRPKLKPRDPASFFRGSEHPRAVHSPDDVMTLVDLVRVTGNIAASARSLGFTESSARQIMSGRSWSHLTGIEARR